MAAAGVAVTSTAPDCQVIELSASFSSTPAKILPAQNYQQRDYSDIERQVMESQAREMDEFLKGAG